MLSIWSPRMCIGRLPPLLFAAVFLISATRIEAQQATPQPARLDPLLFQFTGFIQPGLQLVPFLDRARRVFWTSDTDVDGKVSAVDLEQRRSQFAKNTRANVVSELLRYDSNGDGVAARDEIVRIETQKIR